jgi:hypothetical protein
MPPASGYMLHWPDTQCPEGVQAMHGPAGGPQLMSVPEHTDETHPPLIWSHCPGEQLTQPVGDQQRESVDAAQLGPQKCALHATVQTPRSHVPVPFMSVQSRQPAPHALGFVMGSTHSIPQTMSGEPHVGEHVGPPTAGTQKSAPPSARQSLVQLPQYLMVLSCAAQPLVVPPQLPNPGLQLIPQPKTSFLRTQLGAALTPPAQAEQPSPQPTLGSFFATQIPEQTFWPEVHINEVSILTSRASEASRSVGSSMPRRLPHATPQMGKTEKATSPIKELNGRRRLTYLS